MLHKLKIKGDGISLSHPCWERSSRVRMGAGVTASKYDLRPSQNVDLIGTWTLDIVSGLLFTDRLVGEYFGVSERASRRGVELSVVARTIVERDVKRVRQARKIAMEQNTLLEVTFSVLSPTFGQRKVRAVGVNHQQDGEPIFCSGYLLDMGSPGDRMSILNAIRERTFVARLYAKELRQHPAALALYLDMANSEARDLQDQLRAKEKIVPVASVRSRGPRKGGKSTRLIPELEESEC